MATLSTFLGYFGITLREVAEAFGISHVSLLNIQQGKQSATPHVTAVLAHPLFADFDTGFVPEPEAEPHNLEWLTAQLAVARGRLLKQQNQWNTDQKKRERAQKILHHTRNLEGMPWGEMDLITRWWSWKRSKYKLWLEERRPVSALEHELKLHLVAQEIAWLEQKIGER